MSSNDNVSEGDRVENEDTTDLFNGVSFEISVDGQVVGLTTAGRWDQDRWNRTTPSLHVFPYLQVLELSKCRYLECVDESLVQLKSLRTLRLTRCSRLERLPEAIGQLENLEEVRAVLARWLGQRLLYNLFFKAANQCFYVLIA